jgi:hypothetical protein
MTKLRIPLMEDKWGKLPIHVGCEKLASANRLLRLTVFSHRKLVSLVQNEIWTPNPAHKMTVLPPKIFQSIKFLCPLDADFLIGKPLAQRKDTIFDSSLGLSFGIQEAWIQRPLRLTSSASASNSIGASIVSDFSSIGCGMVQSNHIIPVRAPFE